jgi:hypothetical protein
MNYKKAKENIETLFFENVLNIGFPNMQGIIDSVESYKPKCSVKADYTGEHCPETATEEINGDPVCERCFKSFKHLIK